MSYVLPPDSSYVGGGIVVWCPQVQTSGGGRTVGPSVPQLATGQLSLPALHCTMPV